MKRKLCTLHYAARTSIGIEAGAQSVSFEISFLIEKLQLIRRQVRIIDETLTRLVDNTEEGKYLLSIIGLNYISVAGLLQVLSECQAVDKDGREQPHRVRVRREAERSYPNEQEGTPGTALLCLDLCYSYATI